MNIKVLVRSCMHCARWTTASSTASAPLRGLSAPTPCGTLPATLSWRCPSSSNPLYWRKASRFAFFVLFSSQRFSCFFVPGKTFHITNSMSRMDYALTLRPGSCVGRQLSYTSHDLRTSNAREARVFEGSISHRCLSSLCDYWKIRVRVRFM